MYSSFKLIDPMFLSYHAHTHACTHTHKHRHTHTHIHMHASMHACSHTQTKYPVPNLYLAVIVKAREAKT